MRYDITLRLILVDPPPHVAYGIQRGAGANYETLFVQQPARGDVTFDVPVTVSDEHKDGPNFTGPCVQGPRGGRFVYVDVGTYAGQKNSSWSRRMKVPLDGISWSLILKAARTGATLAAHIPGTGRDAGPNSGTVRLLADWELGS